LQNEPTTGVSIMRMAAGLDTGDVLSQRATPIDPDETGAMLHDRLAVMGGELLVDTIPDYVAGVITPQPQDHAAATYAKKITKADGLLDWSRPALDLRNQVRAFDPWPGAFVHWSGHGQSRLLKIWRAKIEPRQGHPGEVLQADKSGLLVACGVDALRLEQLQLEGKRRMMAAEFLAGHSIEPGSFHQS
jgi:methionyl-tRNA formyltransferase